MTIRDELMRMVEAAGKATPGPYFYVAAGKIQCVAPDGVEPDEEEALACDLLNHSGSLGLKQALADAEFFARCSPERIKALAEVAVAAEAASRWTGTTNSGCGEAHRAYQELEQALERLRKAVGT